MEPISDHMRNRLHLSSRRTADHAAIPPKRPTLIESQRHPLIIMWEHKPTTDTQSPDGMIFSYSSCAEISSNDLGRGASRNQPAIG